METVVSAIPMHKLPSINLLITFDAAARHLSFKKAAEELFVTPSAVGHQIRALEKQLNCKLFIRLNREVELTKVGISYHDQISSAITTLRSATSELIAVSAEHSLLIHSIPYLTNALLVPHIKSFKALYPKMRISIESKVERAQLDASTLQVAIRHGMERSNELEHIRLCEIKASPVCAPSYPIGESLNLIRLPTDSKSWQKWESDWGTKLSFEGTLYCDGMQAVIDMTKQGLGIAMGYFPILDPLIRDDALALPFPDKVSDLDSLYLVYLKKNRGNPVIADVVDWLKNIFDAF